MPLLQKEMSVSGCVETHINFTSQGIHIEADLHVPKKIFIGAGKTPRSSIYDVAYVPDDFEKFTLDPALDNFYDCLIQLFRQVRKKYQLSDTQYVNLMKDYVQCSIIYGKINDYQLYPVETVVHGRGVCSDTTLLLSGLLSKEGYNTAYLSFKNANHAMTGIKVPGEGYRNTGYALIETTCKDPIKINTSYVSETPDVIRIGNGNKEYTGRIH